MSDIDLIEIINAAAWEVRKHLSPGFLESVYQNALIVELRSQGILAEKEVPIKVNYKGVEVGNYIVDVLVEKRIIVELKAVEYLHPAHEAQLVNYLTATGIDHGVLINYGGEKFAFRVKDRIYKRF